MSILCIEVSFSFPFPPVFSNVNILLILSWLVFFLYMSQAILFSYILFCVKLYIMVHYCSNYLSYNSNTVLVKLSKYSVVNLQNCNSFAGRERKTCLFTLMVSDDSLSRPWNKILKQLIGNHKLITFHHTYNSCPLDRYFPLKIERALKRYRMFCFIFHALGN